MEIGSHKNAEETKDGPLPYSADDYSAHMSRAGLRIDDPEGEISSRYRIDLIRRQCFYDATRFNKAENIKQINELKELSKNAPLIEVHKKWLESDLPSKYNEDPGYPYTSHKYHTLIAEAILYNSANDYHFDTFCLAVAMPAKVELTTLIQLDDASLHLVPVSRLSEFTCGYQLPKVGEKPPKEDGKKHKTYPKGCWPNFNIAWVHLDKHPKISKHLDAYIRRIGSWSTALQLMEDWKVMNCF